MKLGTVPKMLAGATLAFAITGGAAVASPLPQHDQKSQSQQDQKKSLYPNATREEPKLDLTDQDTADTLNKGLNAANAGDMAKAKQILQPLAQGTATDSKYAQALALQGMANVKYREKDLPGAIALMQK